MKTINLEVFCGDSLRPTITKACVLAREKNCLIQFNFNDVNLIVSTGEKEADVLNRWEKGMEENRQKYLQSPEYREYQIKRKKEVNANVDIVKSCIASLETTLVQGNDSIMRWVKLFAECADDTEASNLANVNYKDLSNLFIKYGFKPDAKCGLPKEEYNNKQVMCEYIVGQVLSSLVKNSPPNPVASSFVDKYFGLNNE
jgi:hypothetical protein